MIEPNVYPIRKPWITRLPSPLSSPAAIHSPYLVSTTCVSADMIAIGAVVGDWPDGSAPRQPCLHVLDGLPYPLVMRVSHGLECGSHAAAAAALTIRRVAYCYPSWSRGAECARADHRVGQACLRSLRVDGYVARDSCLRTNSHRQHLPAVEMMYPRGLEAHATGSACSPA
jgi:hypothetical protein